MPPRDLGPFVGRWKITHMELWSEDVINQFVPASIEISSEGLGSIQFIAVQGDLDGRAGQRHGHPAIEWSWVGWDDSDETSGRGWCILHDDDTLEGEICFHRGDASGFHAVRGH